MTKFSQSTWLSIAVPAGSPLRELYHTVQLHQKDDGWYWSVSDEPHNGPFPTQQAAFDNANNVCSRCGIMKRREGGHMCGSCGQNI